MLFLQTKPLFGLAEIERLGAGEQYKGSSQYFHEKQQQLFSAELNIVEEISRPRYTYACDDDCENAQVPSNF